MNTRIDLAYGDGVLPIELDSKRFAVTTFLPEHHPALPDARASFLHAVRHPLGSPPLRELPSLTSTRLPRVCIVIADHTRPVPDHLLVPWIVDELGVPDDQVTVLIGTGSHRPTTDAEIRQKLGDAAHRFRVINHSPQDTKANVYIGATRCGTRAELNAAYVNADLRIATGFIEPHFFAGFSGGSKSIMPGIASLSCIRQFHRASLIADPCSTWSIMENNPTQLLSREIVSFCPPHFIVNVTLNLHKDMTGIFAGSLEDAHAAGCERARAEATVPVHGAFPVVLTTNSGYPLDQNFYQAVKGMSAAARIVEQGGVILMASECRNGLPSEGEFGDILREPLSSSELLKKILATQETRHDQWEVQTLLQILEKARVILFSGLSAADHDCIRTETTNDIVRTLDHLYRESGNTTLRIAALPMGPLTIPTLQ